MSTMFPLNVARHELDDWSLLKRLDANILACLKCFKPLNNRLYAITHDHCVFAIGDNADGQLGVGHRDQLGSGVEIQKLRGERVCDIRAGMKHVWALTETGRVWAWGTGKCGELGLGLNVKHALTPMVVVEKDIVAIALGCWHSLALTNTGRVLACGWNSDGRVGLQFILKAWSLVEVNLSDQINIVTIACGSWHSMALDERGRLFLWGQNMYHQIDETTQPVWTPKLIDLNHSSPIASISGTSNRSIMLTADGQLYTRGGDDHHPRVLNPSGVVFRQIVSINYYPLHEGSHKRLHIALSNDGECYVWGNVLHQESEWTQPVKVDSSSMTQVIHLHSCFAGFGEHMLTIR